MKYLAWFLANTIWFSFFFYLILFKDWSAWSLLIPIIVHWRIDEIK